LAIEGARRHALTVAFVALAALDLGLGLLAAIGCERFPHIVGFLNRPSQTLFKKLKPLEIKTCPFTNLPEKKSGRWGAGLTATKMVDCRWVKPVLVGQFEFVEWTGENHLRHSRFVALREDKHAGQVRRE
jgi:ATP-dependent DNA ligase